LEHLVPSSAESKDAAASFGRATGYMQLVSVMIGVFVVRGIGVRNLYSLKELAPCKFVGGFLLVLSTE
jgi:hypothetical protein